MKRTLTAIMMLVLLIPATTLAGEVPSTVQPQQHQAISAWLATHLDGLVKTCKHLHEHPELSQYEEQTAALAANELRDAGYEVITGIGGHGVVGLMANGPGPTVLVRGDMDALPIIEETNLPYASKVKVARPDGRIVGVMHACGHDIHTTTLLGTARLLADHQKLWRGTAIMLAQPAEEAGAGAMTMVADERFKRVPKPDYCISLHVSHRLPAGQINYTSGWSAANVDSVDITIFGRGGHGARPNSAVDPIVTAAHVITQLQTIVSRRISPIEPGVITVGSIHGGAKHNVIPNEVKMQLTVRSYSDEVRHQLLDGIRQITTDVCRSFQCPKPPLVVWSKERTPSCYNDPALTAAAVAVFGEIFGPENIIEKPAGMGGEDFGVFPRHFKVPGLQYSLGTVSRERYEASLKPNAEPLPSLHSSKYQADMTPSVDAGIRTMSALAFALLDDAE
ncbi:MAG: amidohydrolase [bacterium]|nr:amidohydrolase [bacterium]